jgi:hypothetical protein
MKCPFCEEDDFDAIGLKKHLLTPGWCEVFENVPSDDAPKSDREKENP